MINFEEIFERIKLATNTRTQMELAAVLDIRQSSISDAKRRNSVPAEWYMKLFEQFGLNPDWLKQGTGPMYLRTEHGYTPVDAPMGYLFEETAQYGEPDAKNVVVSVYSTLADTEEESSKMSIGKLSIPMSFAHNGLHVVRIDAASMEPHIHKGAFVGLDTTQKRLVSGELFGIVLPYEGICIKRVFIDTQNNRVILRSENPEHPEITLPLNDHSKHIIGRAIWIMQKI